MSSLGRPIGLTGIVRWLAAAAAVIAIGVAISAGQYLMAAATFAFLLVALLVNYRLWRSQQSGDTARHR